MDARETPLNRRRRRTPVDRRRHELNTWLRACDICVDPATNPVAAPCGHLFCSSCLDDAILDGLGELNTCPICDAELLEETTTQNLPTVESVASAEPTRATHTIVSDATASAGNNNTRTGPEAAADMRSSLISEARMAVVQNMIEEEIERTQTRRVDLIRYSNNLKPQRIRGLEQAFETVVQMNLDLLREMEDRDEANYRLRRLMEDRDEDNRRLRRRIVELENPTARASDSDNALGMNSVRHQRVGRRINLTQLATNASVTRI